MENNPYASPSANLFGSTGITSAEAVPQEAIGHLQKTKPWVRLVSVMCFIGGGMMMLSGLIIGLTGGATFANMPKQEGLPPGFGAMMGAGIGIFYAVLSILYLYPGVALWKYANRIGDLANSRSVAHLVAALSQQRSFWTYVGIMMVIGLCFMVLAMALVFVAAAVGFASAKH